MASIKLKGDTSGELTIQAPSVAGTNTLNLPASSGTLATTAQASIGMKNRIINGNMTIDQRNAGASLTITANPQYTLDRWYAGVTNASKISVQQSSTAPTGFTKSMLVTSLAATTPGTSELYYMQQSIEGYNVSDLDFGLVTAKTITISFWVRSSLTGAFGAVLLNASSNRSFPFNYTISTADTWTKITQTIIGDTTGTWATDNSVGFQLRFGLGAGATYQGTAGSWGTTNAVTTTGATSVVGTSGATWYVTGVQLEAGTTATDFENLQYGQQLALCQRYYWKWIPITGYNMIGAGYSSSSTYAYIVTTNPIPMRSAPTLASGGSFRLCSNTCNAVTGISIAASGLYTNFLNATTASGMTAGYAQTLGDNNDTAAYIGFSSEL